jgi:hypothetical protein
MEQGDRKSENAERQNREKVVVVNPISKSKEETQ